MCENYKYKTNDILSEACLLYLVHIYQLLSYYLTGKNISGHVIKEIWLYWWKINDLEALWHQIVQDVSREVQWTDS